MQMDTRNACTEERPCEDTARRQVAIHRPRREASEESNSVDTLTLAFQPLEQRQSISVAHDTQTVALCDGSPGKATQVASNVFLDSEPFLQRKSYMQKPSVCNLKAGRLSLKTMQRLVPSFALSTSTCGPAGNPLGLQGHAVPWAQGRNQWRACLSSEVPTFWASKQQAVTGLSLRLTTIALEQASCPFQWSWGLDNAGPGSRLGDRTRRSHGPMKAAPRLAYTGTPSGLRSLLGFWVPRSTREGSLTGLPRVWKLTRRGLDLAALCQQARHAGNEGPEPGPKLLGDHLTPGGPSSPMTERRLCPGCQQGPLLPALPPEDVPETLLTKKHNEEGVRAEPLGLGTSQKGKRSQRKSTTGPATDASPDPVPEAGPSTLLPLCPLPSVTRLRRAEVLPLSSLLCLRLESAVSHSFKYTIHPL